MSSQNISVTSMLFFIILILPIMLINSKLKLKVNKRIIYVIGRMVIQLSLVGIFLQYIFDYNNPLVNTLYVVLMISIASYSTVKSCNIPFKYLLPPVFIALLVSNIGVLFFFNYFITRIDNVFDAQYMIPIAGMILGNSLSGNIIGINSFYRSIKDRENEYLYTLSLCGNRQEALRPYFKKALMDSINPTLASIETIGLVSLPGMMTGQILGGAVPVTAIKYQIAIMIGILISRYFSITLAIILSIPKAFDDYDLLSI